MTLLTSALLLTVACSADAQVNKQSADDNNSTDKNVAETATDKSTVNEVVSLTKQEFFSKVYNYEKNKEKWVYEGKLPCIIDFYADWCGPCKRVEPVLKQLAKDYAGKIIVYKVDTERERELAMAFGIRSIPTYFFVPLDSVPSYMAGALPRESFVKIIDEFLLKK
jgi:thioredoxin